ncbi:hypothetical protein [Nocardioides xinjiangensis]|uniref:hypothetical protein n=1 Tax=Nocardioides xinjiangensis TaxID=2817376 RepID=UPI001B3136F1|nr:hypothetical protein [Nocardioides sp. SYSU D00514]
MRRGEHERWAAVHRAAWSATFRVTAAAYERLMTLAPHDPGLDHVVTGPDGDDGYPAPGRLHRRIGFRAGARSRTYGWRHG